MLSADEVLGLRLERQLIERPSGGATSRAHLDPAEVVRHLCAMQAQDYRGALWSVGLRSDAGCTADDVERAIAERRIIRTWPMRGTLHFVAPEDVRWMLALLSPRVLVRARARHEQLGITAETLERARAVFTDALTGGQALTRGEMMALLEADGIDTTGQRGYHVLWTLAQNAVLCCGPQVGTQQTFVLLDEWIPPDEADEPLEPAAALGRLATRYFEARGPATVADFAWWAGITKTDARTGLGCSGDILQRTATDAGEYWMPAGVVRTLASPAASPRGASPTAPSVHLLPGFDEYFLGYTDRRLQLGEHLKTYGATVSANGVFSATLIASGHVVGTWKRTLRRDRVDIALRLFRTLTAAEKQALAGAVDVYGHFLGRRVTVTV